MAFFISRNSLKKIFNFSNYYYLIINTNKDGEKWTKGVSEIKVFIF